MSDIIFQKNEQFAELYNDFEQKVKKLMQPKQKTGANNENRAKNTIENESSIPTSHVNTTNNHTNVRSTHTPSRSHSLGSGQSLPNDRQSNQNGINAILDRNSQNNILDLSQGSHSVQVNTHGHVGSGRNDLQLPINAGRAGDRDPIEIFQDNSANPRASLSQSIQTAATGNDGLSLLQRMLGNGIQGPMHANATMNSNDNARLSEQFQPSHMSLLTPITSDANHSVPIHPNDHVNTNTFNTNNANQQNADGLLQIFIPPDNFGHNRLNSLPSTFGANAPQRNGHSSSDVTQSSLMGGDRFSNGIGGAPPVNTFASLPRTVGTQSNLNIPNVNNQPQYYRVPNHGDSVPRQVNPNPSQYGSAPNQHNTYNVTRDQPQNNFNCHSQQNNVLDTHGNSNRSIQPSNATEEKLDLIMATLSSLSNEVQSFRQWRNSFASNSSRVNEPVISNGPSATYTVNSHNMPHIGYDSQVSFNRF